MPGHTNIPATLPRRSFPVDTRNRYFLFSRRLRAFFVPILHPAPKPSFETALRNRRANGRDACEIARWIIEDLPVPTHLMPMLAQTLREFLSEERLHGVCVEEIVPRPWPEGPQRRPVAFGLSAFLSDDCVAAQIASPRAYFWMELLTRASQEKVASDLLPLRDLAEANAGDGCNLFPFLWIQRPTDVSSPEGGRLLTRGMRSLLDDHRGFNLKSILKEAAREQQEAFTQGGLRKIGSCCSGPGASAGNRLLFGLTRDEARQVAFGSALSLLFVSTRPHCGFARIQQHVLLCALDDMSDEEIADHLNITPHAVNMRWRAIYERIEHLSDLAALVYSDSSGANRNGSGTQKRRRVVSYVRSHPEELRPYRWK